MIKGTNNRDSAAYGSLEIEVAVMLLSSANQLGTAGIHHRLVRAYHMLTLFQTAFNILVCRMNSSDRFHHKLHFRIIFNDGKICSDQGILHTGNMLFSGQNVLYFNTFSALFLNLCSVHIQHFFYAGSDGSVAHDSNLHLIRPFLLLRNFSCFSHFPQSYDPDSPTASTSDKRK